MCLKNISIIVKQCCNYQYWSFRHRSLHTPALNCIELYIFKIHTFFASFCLLHKRPLSMPKVNSYISIFIIRMIVGNNPIYPNSVTVCGKMRHVLHWSSSPNLLTGKTLTKVFTSCHNELQNLSITNSTVILILLQWIERTVSDLKDKQFLNSTFSCF